MSSSMQWDREGSGQAVHKDEPCVLTVDKYINELTTTTWLERLAKHGGDREAAGKEISKEYQEGFAPVKEAWNEEHGVTACTNRDRDLCWQSIIKLANKAEVRLGRAIERLLRDGNTDLRYRQKPAPKTSYDAVLEKDASGGGVRAVALFHQATFSASPRFKIQGAHGVAWISASPVEHLIAPMHELECAAADAGILSKSGWVQYNNMPKAFTDAHRVWGPVDAPEDLQRLEAAFETAKPIPTARSSPMFPFDAAPMYLRTYQDFDLLIPLLLRAANELPPPAVKEEARARAELHPTKVARDLLESNRSGVIISPLPVVTLVEVLRTLTLRSERLGQAAVPLLVRLNELVAADAAIDDGLRASVDKTVELLEAYVDALAHRDQPPSASFTFSKVIATDSNVIDYIGHALKAWQVAHLAHLPELERAGAKAKANGSGGGGGGGGGSAAAAAGAAAASASAGPSLADVPTGATKKAGGRSHAAPLESWTTSTALDQCPKRLVLPAGADDWRFLGEDTVVLGAAHTNLSAMREESQTGRHALGPPSRVSLNWGLDGAFLFPQGGGDDSEEAGGAGAGGSARPVVLLHAQHLPPLGVASTPSSLLFATAEDFVGSAEVGDPAFLQEARGLMAPRRVAYLARRLVELIGRKVVPAAGVAVATRGGGASLMGCMWSGTERVETREGKRRVWVPTLARQRAAAGARGSAARQRFEADVDGLVLPAVPEAVVAQAARSLSVDHIKKKLSFDDPPPAPTHYVTELEGVGKDDAGVGNDASVVFCPVRHQRGGTTFTHNAVGMGNAWALIAPAFPSPGDDDDEDDDDTALAFGLLAPATQRNCGHFRAVLASGHRGDVLFAKGAETHVAVVPAAEAPAVLRKIGWAPARVTRLSRTLTRGRILLCAPDDGGGDKDDDDDDDGIGEASLDPAPNPAPTPAPGPAQEQRSPTPEGERFELLLLYADGAAIDAAGLARRQIRKGELARLLEAPGGRLDSDAGFGPATRSAKRRG